jgi:hypothetical protein
VLCSPIFLSCVNDLVGSDRIDGDGLLRQAVERLHRRQQIRG